MVSTNPAKRGSRDVETGPTPEGSPGPAGVVQSSTTLPFDDERSQTVHLGTNPREFGVVVAEAQRLLDQSRTRALHLESFAQEINV